LRTGDIGSAKHRREDRRSDAGAQLAPPSDT
jgi:hypothetical protein